MICARLQKRSGGTLLEVLLSLIIIAMILDLVLQVSAQSRHAKQLARDARESNSAAIEWRQARIRNVPWAQGDEGMLSENSLHWSLLSLDEPKSALSREPDRQWRMLQLTRKNEAQPFARIIVRVQNAREAQP
jgi:type II secretory pathway pseudopilin PulG